MYVHCTLYIHGTSEGCLAHWPREWWRWQLLSILSIIVIPEPQQQLSWKFWQLMATVWTTQECGLHHFHRHHHFDHHNSGQVGPPMADTGVWSEKPVPAHGVTLPRASYNIHNTYTAHVWRHVDTCMRMFAYVCTTRTHLHIWIYPMGITYVVKYVFTFHLSVHCTLQGIP